MKNLFFFLVFISIYSSGCNKLEDEGLVNEYDYMPDYKRVVKAFLLKEAFDDPKYLSSIPEIVMIPQEFAFGKNDVEIKQDLSVFYNSMTLSLNDIKTMRVKNHGLSRLSLIKAVSHYLRLIKENGQASSGLEQKLLAFTLSEIEYFYNLSNPGWPPLINGNVRERIIWGLENWNDVPKGLNNYAFSINDDIWRLAEANANMFVYLEKSKQFIPNYIKELRELSYQFVNEGGVTSRLGYVFQPGSISDHPDNLYAGHEKIFSNIEHKEVEGLGWDTSHFSMFPSMIYSLKKSFEKDEIKFNYLSACSQEISNMFYGEIVEEIGGSTYTKNYMDGTNGVYRYDEKTTDGYLPYELSGTILFGHWLYMNTKENYVFFNNLFNSFPLKHETIKTYQSIFYRNRGSYSDNQIEFLYENPSIRVYSYFCIRLSEKNF